VIGIHGSWRDVRQDTSISAWVERAHEACAPLERGTGYVNFSSDDHTPSGELFGRHTARLVEAKRRWDPHNLFCLNANLDPDGA
jgi:hypothetical protein